MKKIRTALINFAQESGIEKLSEKLEKLVYRPVSEVYIPLPDSKKFHDARPDFFGHNVGTFDETWKKLALTKEERTFTLRFLSSGDTIDAYINQQSGKAIQSVDRQDILPPTTARYSEKARAALPTSLSRYHSAIRNDESAVGAA